MVRRRSRFINEIMIVLNLIFIFFFPEKLYTSIKEKNKIIYASDLKVFEKSNEVVKQVQKNTGKILRLFYLLELYNFFKVLVNF